MRRAFLLLLVMAALAGGAYAYYQSRQVSGPLTGEKVYGEIAGRRPVAVMIDNLAPDARPQTGLASASVVFETLAEGGITRFMAVYQEHEAPMIGPVRSTRLYYNSWAAGLGVIFGHDGGNVDALQQLPSLSTIYNEDADRITGPFWRITTRLAPHNEYTSTARLLLYAQNHGGAMSGVRMSIPHKGDALGFQRPGRFTLHIQFSYADYNVAWQYDPGSNDFLRFMGGQPHVEASTGKQIRAKNVVIMETTESAASDPYTAGAIHLVTTGSGKATVYVDGKAIAGTWSKPTVDSPLQWLDGAGNPIKLDVGATWVEVIPSGNSVTTSSG